MFQEHFKIAQKTIVKMKMFVLEQLEALAEFFLHLLHSDAGVLNIGSWGE